MEPTIEVSGIAETIARKLDPLREFAKSAHIGAAIVFEDRRPQTIGGRRLRGGSNLLIAEVQAKAGRNVWQVLPADLARIVARIRAGVRETIASENASAANAIARRVVLKAMNELKETFVKRIASSSFPKRPLSAAYAAWNRRAAPGASILVLTGQLRDSMKVVIGRWGGRVRGR